jgi:general secretion pathway protein G
MYSDIGFFPDSDTGLNLLIENGAKLKAWKGPYIHKEGLTDRWQNEFIYKYDSISEKYLIYSIGPNGIDDNGNQDDILCGKYCLKNS